MKKNQNTYLPEDILIPHFGLEKEIVGVEIGVSGGASTAALLIRMPNLTLYSIDPWLFIDGAPFEAGLPQEIQDQGYNNAISISSHYPGKSFIIRKKSDDAVNDVPDIIDFLHIDGDHEYEQVIRDINNYMPKIRPGGIISGHDYILRPGVVKAVDELFMGRVKFGDDFIWWVEL